MDIDRTEIENTTLALSETAATVRRLVKNAVKNFARDVAEIGRNLTEAKALCDHGAWLSRLEREFDWSEQTARNYMHIFELSKSTNFVELSRLDLSSLYLLAAPSTPETVRDDVAARVRAGEKLRVTDVRAAVAASRPVIDCELVPHVQLYGSKPAVAERTMEADDFQNALLEGIIKDIQSLENKYRNSYLRLEHVMDALADARRIASARLKLKPVKSGGGIHLVK